jgi:hypothetical protein
MLLLGAAQRSRPFWVLPMWWEVRDVKELSISQYLIVKEKTNYALRD